MAEECTGVILFSRHTLLVGNTVFGSIYNILGASDYSYDRENAQGDSKISSVAVRKRSIDRRTNMFGNIVAATTTATMLPRLFDLYSEYYRVYYLYNSGRKIPYRTTGFGDRAEVRGICAAFEYAYVTFTTEKYNLLFKNCNTVKFLTASAAQTSLKGYFNVKSDSNSIKSPVESYGINTNICPGYTCAFCANVCCVLKYFVSKIGKQNFYIFKAVFISTGIKNSVSFDAYHF